jgi:hypothetical protein
MKPWIVAVAALLSVFAKRKTHRVSVLGNASRQVIAVAAMSAARIQDKHPRPSWLNDIAWVKSGSRVRRY